jgi:hypothetical protein
LVAVKFKKFAIEANNVPNTFSFVTEEEAAVVVANVDVPVVVRDAIVAVPTVVVASAVVPVAVRLPVAKLLEVAFVIVPLVAVKPSTFRTDANRFVIFAHTIDDDATVEVAIVVVPPSVVPLPAIVTTFEDDAKIFTISPTDVVVASTIAAPLSFVIDEESTIWIVPPI